MQRRFPWQDERGMAVKDQGQPSNGSHQLNGHEAQALRAENPCTENQERCSQDLRHADS